MNWLQAKRLNIHIFARNSPAISRGVVATTLVSPTSTHKPMSIPEQPMPQPQSQPHTHAPTQPPTQPPSPTKLLALILLFTACARSPLKDPNQAMRPCPCPKQFQDDKQLRDLSQALKLHRDYFSTQPATKQIRFGIKVISAQTLSQNYDQLVLALERDPSGQQFLQLLQTQFECYEVYGLDSWGDVFITSYYEPIINGSLKPNKIWTQPLYKTPSDMVLIDIQAFSTQLPAWAPMANSTLEQRSPGSIARGRLVPATNADELPQIVPYYARAEIDGKKALQGRKLELAWVSPVDAFFLQIQGSGIVKLSNGRELRVGYHSQNGHPYFPIGKALFDKIPKEDMTMQAIEKHLLSLDPAQAQDVMNQNPSYVFFTPLDGSAKTFMGTPLIAGRTIATDQTLFPKGALAWLEFEQPEFASSTDIKPIGFTKKAQFVIDQDTGGAIRGPHRVDLYWGQGDSAKQVAGAMRSRGRLIYLVPKN